MNAASLPMGPARCRLYWSEVTATPTRPTREQILRAAVLGNPTSMLAAIRQYRSDMQIHYGWVPGLLESKEAVERWWR